MMWTTLSWKERWIVGGALVLLGVLVIVAKICGLVFSAATTFALVAWVLGAAGIAAAGAVVSPLLALALWSFVAFIVALAIIIAFFYWLEH